MDICDHFGGASVINISFFMLENKCLLSKVLRSYCRVNKFLLKEKQAYVVFYIGSRTISNIFYISHLLSKGGDCGPESLVNVA